MDLGLAVFLGAGLIGICCYLMVVVITGAVERVVTGMQETIDEAFAMIRQSEEGYLPPPLAQPINPVDQSEGYGDVYYDE